MLAENSAAAAVDDDKAAAGRKAANSAAAVAPPATEAAAAVLVDEADEEVSLGDVSAPDGLAAYTEHSRNLPAGDICGTCSGRTSPGPASKSVRKTSPHIEGSSSAGFEFGAGDALAVEQGGGGGGDAAAVAAVAAIAAGLVAVGDGGPRAEGPERPPVDNVGLPPGKDCSGREGHSAVFRSGGRRCHPLSRR